MPLFRLAVSRMMLFFVYWEKYALLGQIFKPTYRRKGTYQDQMNTALPDYININSIKTITTNKCESTIINDF